MKNSLVTVMVLVFIIMLCTGTVKAVSIGYIDVQEVYSSYDKTKKYEENFKQKERKLQDEISIRQKKLEKEQNKGASEAELRKLVETFEKEIEPKKNEIMEFQKKTLSEIQNDIVKATDDVAKSAGLEIVIDRQMIIAGGMDISDKVIRILNKK
jgi:Skp family chaperone for outer membrane proteins